jgi:hypothetical protein
MKVGGIVIEVLIDPTGILDGNEPTFGGAAELEAATAAVAEDVAEEDVTALAKHEGIACSIRAKVIECSPRCVSPKRSDRPVSTSSVSSV